MKQITMQHLFLGWLLLFITFQINGQTSIFTTQTPSTFSNGSYELGLKFKSAQFAQINSIRYYKSATETGSHTATLWTSTGEAIATASFGSETAGAGWKTATFTNPITITPNTVYVASVNINTSFAYAVEQLNTQITNDFMTALASGGVYSGKGTFPNTTWNNSNYFVDVSASLLEKPSVPILSSPFNGQAEISVEPKLTWSKVNNAATYQLQVSNNLDFTDLFLDVANLSANSYDLTNINLNKNYFWRVKAINPAGASAFSTDFQFKTMAAPTIFLSWPSNGYEQYTSTPTLSWYILVGGSGWKYDLLYSKNSDMSSPFTISNLTSTMSTISNLEPGEIYYWQVKLKTSSGRIISTSEIYSFTSFGKAVMPIASYPAFESEVYTLTPTLYWYNVESSTGLTYEIELKEGSASALNGTANIFNISDQYKKVNTLKANKLYSWQVRSKSGTKYSLWSVPATFKTSETLGPVVPIPSWPIASATVYTEAPKVYWYTLSNGTGLKYEVEYVEGINTSFSNALKINDISSFYTVLPNLTPGKSYKWRVRSNDGTSNSDWSSEAIFNIAEALESTPVIPILSWPIGLATVYSSETKLYWYTGSSSSSLTYEVEYSNAALTGTASLTGITSLNATISNLLPATTYSWRVRSVLGSTKSDWSEVATFKTIEAPVYATQPILSWPIGGVTVYTSSPTLGWFISSPSAGVKYDLEYSKFNNMSNSTKVLNIIANTYQVSGLEAGVTYYWRVLSKDANVTSAYSAIESFVLSVGASQSAVPVAASPADGVALLSANTSFSWFLPTFSQVSTYELQYSKNADLTNSINVKVSSPSFVSNNLESATAYYWRVRAIDINGNTSSYSNIEKFISARITDINDTKEVPTEFSLKQNYPNPFNPSTTIEFSVPLSGKYSLKVYNMIGQEVASLINSEISAGNHRVNFNATNLSSGVYLYRLTGNNVNLAKKLILMK